MSRRPPKLIAETEPPRVWRLRLDRGAIEEPLNHLHVKAFVETGVASADSQIAAVGTDAWQRLGDHALWADIAPPPSTAKLSVSAPVDVGVIPVAVHQTTPRMQAIWDEQRAIRHERMLAKAEREQFGRFLQGLGYASAIAGLICVGDIIVFTCSLVTAFVFLVALVRLVALALVWKAMK
jgi:hypothetical protein